MVRINTQEAGKIQTCAAIGVAAGFATALAGEVLYGGMTAKSRFQNQFTRYLVAKRRAKTPEAIAKYKSADVHKFLSKGKPFFIIGATIALTSAAVLIASFCFTKCKIAQDCTKK